MTTRKLAIILLMPLVAGTACRHRDDAADISSKAGEIYSVPRPTLLNIQGQNDKLYIQDLERYVNTYGWKAWLIGLDDTRSVQEAGGGSRGSMLPQQYQEGQNHVQLQVKDLFLWYYVQQPWHDTRISRTPNLSRFELDALASAAEIDISVRWHKRKACPKFDL